MIQHIYIKNFKAFEKETILIGKHSIIIGENDSGKTSILQALDIFFNQDKVEKANVRNLQHPVEIGIYYNNSFLKKIYKGTTFKESPTDFVGNFELISNLVFIYIPMNSYDPKSLISQLSVSKASEKTPLELLNQLRAISQNAINEVISSINVDLLVINGTDTEIVGTEAFKYDSSLKFSVQSNGIPIESRGSGFQKNLMYALLVGSTYDNVILGIDEIENSFSINNCSNLLSEIKSKIGQTIITTHSRKVLEISGDSKIIPIFSNENVDTLSKLLVSLDNTDNKSYLLVEGKYDLPWFEKILSLINRSNQYIVLPGGGHGNATHLENSLTSMGKHCITIKDGDIQGHHTLSKECIELYTPLEVVNMLFYLNLDMVPNTKTDFFSATTVENSRTADTVKCRISCAVNDFLNNENIIVAEVLGILQTFEEELNNHAIHDN